MKQTLNWAQRFSNSVQALPTGGLKDFLELIATNDKVISLGIGEPDFSAPHKVCQSIIGSLTQGKTKYTSSYGDIRLRRAIAAYVETAFGVSYHPEQEILVTVGVSEGLDLAMRALVGPGDEVLIPDPCYVANKACILLAGATPVAVPTFPEHGFAPQLAELERAVTPQTKAIMLGYPTNPTGATLNRAQLEVIAAFAKKHDLIVISDELYADLTFIGRHISMASIEGMRERTITLNGFSKAFAMTGLRIGYVLAPQPVIEAMVNIHQYTMLCASVSAQIGALTALEQALAERDEMVETYNQRRLLMVEGFKQIGLDCFEPQGAFYIFPSVQKTGLSSMDFAKKLLVEQEVAVIPGNAFGAAGEGFVRCAYCNSTDNLRESIKRMDALVNRKL